jgi:hypothetical protein
MVGVYKRIEVMLRVSDRSKLTKMISMGAMVRCQLCKETLEPTLTIHYFSFLKPIRGTFDISFYRLQVKYIEECMRLRKEFVWKHPYKIECDVDGIIWY